MMPRQNPVAHSGGVASLASKARPAEHVVNLTDLSLPPDSYSHALDGLYRVAREGERRGGLHGCECMNLNTYLHMYSVCLSWWAWGGKAACGGQAGWGMKCHIGADVVPRFLLQKA